MGATETRAAFRAAVWGIADSSGRRVHVRAGQESYRDSRFDATLLRRLTHGRRRSSRVSMDGAVAPHEMAELRCQLPRAVSAPSQAVVAEPVFLILSIFPQVDGQPMILLSWFTADRAVQSNGPRRRPSSCPFRSINNVVGSPMKARASWTRRGSAQKSGRLWMPISS